MRRSALAGLAAVATRRSGARRKRRRHTVAGTLLEAEKGHFTLADVEDRTLRVDAGRLRLRDLAPGQLITVTGRIADGELKA